MSLLAARVRRMLWVLPLAAALMLVTWWPTQGEITTVLNGLSIFVGFAVYVAASLLLLGLMVVIDQTLRVRQDVSRLQRRTTAALP